MHYFEAIIQWFNTWVFPPEITRIWLSFSAQCLSGVFEYNMVDWFLRKTTVQKLRNFGTNRQINVKWHFLTYKHNLYSTGISGTPEHQRWDHGVSYTTYNLHVTEIMRLLRDKGRRVGAGTETRHGKSNDVQSLGRRQDNAVHNLALRALLMHSWQSCTNMHMHTKNMHSES